MPRPRRHKKPRSLGRSLGLLLLVNIVPVAVLAVLAVMYSRGEIEIQEDRIPAGMTETLLTVGAVFVVLFLVASVSLPAAHDGVKAIEARLRRGANVLRGREPGSRFLVVLLWPFLALTWLLGWTARFVLIVLSFALIGAVVFFLCRLEWPELGQEQIDWVLELPDRLGE